MAKKQTTGPKSQEVTLPTDNKTNVETTVKNVVETKLETHEVKYKEVQGLPEYEGKVKLVVGEKVVMTVTGKKDDVEFTKTIAFPKPKDSRQRSVVTNIPEIGDCIVSFEKIYSVQGRPVDQNSERQQRLAEQEEKRKALEAQGLTLKRGREIDPNSDRQQRLAERDEKMTNLFNQYKVRQRVTLKEQNPDATPEQIEADPTMTRAHFDKNYELKKGRHVDPNSERQQILAERAERAAANGGKMERGRPKDPNSNMTFATAMALTDEDIAALEAAK